jgi:hypothetical protein
MAQFKDKLDPERLVEAAEAALKAAVENSEQTGGPWPYPVDLMGSPMQPECLTQFTKFEIQEACQFLVRLGILESPSAKRRAA